MSSGLFSLPPWQLDTQHFQVHERNLQHEYTILRCLFNLRPSRVEFESSFWRNSMTFAVLWRSSALTKNQPFCYVPNATQWLSVADVQSTQAEDRRQFQVIIHYQQQPEHKNVTHESASRVSEHIKWFSEYIWWIKGQSQVIIFSPIIVWCKPAHEM